MIVREASFFQKQTSTPKLSCTSNVQIIIKFLKKFHSNYSMAN